MTCVYSHSGEHQSFWLRINAVCRVMTLSNKRTHQGPTVTGSVQEGCWGWGKGAEGSPFLPGV